MFILAFLLFPVIWHFLLRVAWHMSYLRISWINIHYNHFKGGNGKSLAQKIHLNFLEFQDIFFFVAQQITGSEAFISFLFYLATGKMYIVLP